MLEKVKKDIFFVSRLFVSLYLSLFLIISYKNIDYLSAFLLGFYFLTNVYIYIFTRPRFLKLVSLLSDLILVPAFIFLSGSFLTLYALNILIALYSWRKPLVAFLIALSAFGLSFYYFLSLPLILTAHLLLFLGVFFSSYNFEYATVIGKERRRILKLRKDYRTLLNEFSRFERERRMFNNLRKVFKLLRESREPRDYLTGLKKEFNLRGIKVVPVREISNEVEKDFDKGTLSVNVKLEEGYAKVIYEFPLPFMLRDEVLTYTLVEAAKMLSVLVEGFEEGEEGKEAVVIA
ncbi:hypothetical protein JCM9492_03820 [Aquifex pyrophilus]